MTISPEQLMQAGLIRKDVELVIDLDPILEQYEQLTKLPLEQRDYLSLYLNLENYVLHSGLGYTPDDLRLALKNKFNTKWFPARMKALFECSVPLPLMLTEIFLEEIFNQFLRGGSLNIVQNKLSNFTSETSLQGIKIINNEADFSKIDSKIYATDINYSETLSDMHKVLLSVHRYFIKALGTSQVQVRFKAALKLVKEKYGALPSFNTMVKLLPDGLVDEEKLSLLTMEELAKVSRKLSVIDVMKSEFTNIAAHELKTPLVPMVGYVEMMLKNPEKYGLNKNGQKLIKIFSRNTHRLHQLVDEILDISKLESGEMKFEMEDVILSPTIVDVVSDLEPLAKEKNLELKTFLPAKNIKPKVVADVQRISQVISNLVKNAIKFTDAGSITVKAEVKQDKFQVSVKDSGPGLEKDLLEKVFEKFYQSQQASTRKTRGTGLGLAICKSIITAHEGTIWATSAGLGKGSIFIFSLPIKKG
jgi:signal transduction histidine kinase